MDMKPDNEAKIMNLLNECLELVELYSKIIEEHPKLQEISIRLNKIAEELPKEFKKYNNQL